ncbi:hypothetical protein ACIQPQ_19725 [Streptomyces sp. NPDC091281]|uniref:hypothetical protein n=1 Tax=Streptomyces sp. NPDC091281 TaxID=3365985 RepID=UPI0038232C99
MSLAHAFAYAPRPVPTQEDFMLTLADRANVSGDLAALPLLSVEARKDGAVTPVMATPIAVAAAGANAAIGVVGGFAAAFAVGYGVGQALGGPTRPRER